MLNMLIIDDEPIIADGLYKLVEENYADRIRIHQVYSTKQALQHSERVKLDIVLSDVLMPEMNGLQLQERILRQWKYCQFIFITGHDDFPYIQQAMRNGSISYILKTEEDGAILEAIDRAVAQIDNIYQMQNILQDSRRQKQQALPFLRNQLFIKWLRGDKGTQEEMQNQMDELEFVLCAKRPVLPVLVQFDELEPDASFKMAEPFSLMETIMARLLPSLDQMNFQLSVSQQVFLFQGEDGFERTVLGSLEQVQEIFHDQTGRDTIFMAGRTAGKWRHIDRMIYYLRHNIRQNLGQRLVRVQSIDYEDDTRLAEEQLLETMRLHLSNRCESGFFAAWDQLFFLLSKPTAQVNDRRTTQALRLLVMAREACLDMNLERRLDATECIELVDALMVDRGNWRACVLRLKDVFQQLFVALTAENDLRAHMLVNKINSYICEHLKEDLSLTRLGEVTCYNASYLSSVYKRLTGQALVEYVNQMRIDRAKQLLLCREMRIRQIALECGFESQQYFNRLFKKKTGLTPNEYRERAISFQ